MPEYLTERYEPGLSVDAARADALRLAETVAAMQAEGARITFLGFTFLPGDEGSFGRFRSSSTELVAAACARAAVACERIVETVPVANEGGKSP
jgi:hypothetical protein